MARTTIAPAPAPTQEAKPELDPKLIRWERDVYDADPTGGAPSPY